MNKRYQVFISSTFTDLEDERREVIQALLELDCIPAGMELFPAADDDQWSLIRKVIDDCDYYLVIVAGRYGSVSKKTGLSYTEMEYRYAIEKGKPVLGFVHESPGDIPSSRTEKDEAARDKLSQFRDLVREKMCRHWRTPKDLGGAVSRSMVNAIKTRPAVGWIRADRATDDSSAQEILRLKRQTEVLEKELLDRAPPHGTEDLAQGNDPVEVIADFSPARGHTERFRTTLSWNELFSAAVPQLLRGAAGGQIGTAIENFLQRELQTDIEARFSMPGNISLDAYLLDTIKMQFEALGLIRLDDASGARSYDFDPTDYWALTPYGREVGYRVRAVRRDTVPAENLRHPFAWDRPPKPPTADDDIPF